MNSPKQLTRPIPSDTTLEWRKQYLKNLRNIEPVNPSTPEPTGLSEGNKKTGKTGTLYATVFVWNIPSVTTCPGASEWCLNHCYNADPREDVFPVQEWAENWWWVMNQPQILRDKIRSQLSVALKPCAVRIHSSGDFFSESYIRFWVGVAHSSADTTFWAYTRSWAREDLVPALEELRSLENVHLFASWDKTMQTPPKHWRLSVVKLDSEQAEEYALSSSSAYICPEQIGEVSNCASCGLCMQDSDKSVLFYLH